MKTILRILLCICIMAAFSGCKASETQAEKPVLLPAETAALYREETGSPETAEIASASGEDVFQSILTGTGRFFDRDTQKEVTIQEFCDTWAEQSGITVTAPQYCAADMDGDGEEELVFKLLINGVSDYGVEVLHEENGIVWGYTFSERQLGKIKQDGSFWYSGSEQDGSARLVFDSGSYSYTDIPVEQYESQPDILWYDN